MSRLADVIERRQEEIVRRYVARARCDGAATSLSDPVIADALLGYLRELRCALRENTRIEQSASATAHGKQRFELGYDLRATVAEYGTLYELLFDVLDESGESVTIAELRTLARFLIHGIEDSATQYAIARQTRVREDMRKYLAFLAHELRNPLGSARMALAFARDRGEVASSQLTESIERSLRRVGTLLDDALVSIRLEEQDALTYEDFQVRELLAQLVNDSAAEAAAKAETIVIEGSACAHADRRSLASALSNLLRNAVKFTKPGGSIHLRVKEVDCRIMIEVEDGCGGLPGGTVHKLFDPFVQAGADRSGFGLGLAIAEQATEAHGGTLRVHDLPGRGCVFVLDIPAAPARQAG